MNYIPPANNKLNCEFVIKDILLQIKHLNNFINFIKKMNFEDVKDIYLKSKSEILNEEKELLKSQREKLKFYKTYYK